jgi:hypothetical protein
MSTSETLHRHWGISARLSGNWCMAVWNKQTGRAKGLHAHHGYTSPLPALSATGRVNGLHGNPKSISYRSGWVACAPGKDVVCSGFVCFSLIAHQCRVVFDVGFRCSAPICRRCRSLEKLSFGKLENVFKIGAVKNACKRNLPMKVDAFPHYLFYKKDEKF